VDGVGKQTAVLLFLISAWICCSLKDLKNFKLFVVLQKLSLFWCLSIETLQTIFICCHIKFDKHLPQSPFTGKKILFLDDDILKAFSIY
jgi:hypothetical protein